MEAIRPPAATVAQAPARRLGALRRPVRRATSLLAVAGLVCLMALVRAYVASPMRVVSDSMEPTLYAGDVVFVDRRNEGLDRLSRGDLVTFAEAGESGRRLLKRVVALPGDSVATIDAELYVNDRPVPERYVDFTDWEGIFSARIVVPSGHVYVLGDNRGASVDSREFGPVPIADVDGRVLLRLWPPVRAKRGEPRS